VQKVALLRDVSPMTFSSLSAGGAFV